MEYHWDEATFLLETLVMKARGQDEIGMSLAFTNDIQALSGSNDPRKFVKAMHSARKTFGDARPSELKLTLLKTLEDYTKQRSSKVKRHVTIIVLTDCNQLEFSGVHSALLAFRTKVREIYASNRAVTVQFIQFGFDLNVLRELEELEDDLNRHGDPLIDVEHSRGNVNKMLLGSFVEEYDSVSTSGLKNFNYPLVGPNTTPQSGAPRKNMESGSKSV